MWSFGSLYWPIDSMLALLVGLMHRHLYWDFGMAMTHDTCHFYFSLLFIKDYALHTCSLFSLETSTMLGVCKSFVSLIRFGTIFPSRWYFKLNFISYKSLLTLCYCWSVESYLHLELNLWPWAFGIWLLIHFLDNMMFMRILIVFHPKTA